MSQVIQRIEYTILILSLATMAGVAFVNVVTRFILGSSIAFTEEITVNLFVVLTFMGASVGIHRKAHLGFNLIFESLKGPMKISLITFIGCITAFIFGIITYFGMDMVLFQKQLNQLSPALGWPQWIFSLGLPIGSLFCLFRVVEATFLEIRDTWRDGGHER